MSQSDSPEAMRLAISRKDLRSFKALLNNGFDINTPLQTSKRHEEEDVSLIETLTKAGFVCGVRVFLERFSSRLNDDTLRKAFMWSVRKGSSKLVTKIFLEWALDQTMSFLSTRQIYHYAMNISCYSIASQALECPRFDVNGRMSIEGVDWHLPLQEAVSHHQTEMIETLLANGARVDRLSNTHISALMVACHMIYPAICRQLLRHGADPNYPHVTSNLSHLNIKWLTKRACLNRGITSCAKVPPRFGYNNWRTTTHDDDKADEIVCLLIEAGLKNRDDAWIRKSPVVQLISDETKQRLSRLNCEMKSLKSLAVIKARDYIRSLCGGVRFNQAVNSLPIAYLLKKQITLEMHV